MGGVEREKERERGRQKKRKSGRARAVRKRVFRVDKKKVRKKEGGGVKIELWKT